MSEQRRGDLNHIESQDLVRFLFVLLKIFNVIENTIKFSTQAKIIL